MCIAAIGQALQGDFAGAAHTEFRSATGLIGGLLGGTEKSGASKNTNININVNANSNSAASGTANTNNNTNINTNASDWTAARTRGHCEHKGGRGGCGAYGGQGGYGGYGSYGTGNTYRANDLYSGYGGAVKTATSTSISASPDGTVTKTTTQVSRSGGYGSGAGEGQFGSSDYLSTGSGAWNPGHAFGDLPSSLALASGASASGKSASFAAVIGPKFLLDLLGLGNRQAA